MPKCRLHLVSLEDRTVPSVSLIADINRYSQETLRTPPIEMNGYVYFNHASADGQSLELWKSDGTPTGASRVAAVSMGTEAEVQNGLLYFLSAEFGTELWPTDGTAEGTIQLLKVEPPYPAIDNLIPALGTMFFCARDVGHSMWVTDGTVAGTLRLPGSGLQYPSLAGSKLYYGGFPGNLYASDGTVEGTVPVPNHGSIHVMEAVGNELYYSDIPQDPPERYSIFRSDGTAAGAQHVADVPRLNSGGWPDNYEPLNGKVYFTAGDPTHGREIWVTDGTPLGTSMLLDLRPGPEGSTPEHLTVLGSTLYFSADDGTNGLELWKSDGTELGTERVLDMVAGPDGAEITKILTFNNRLYFIGKSDEYGQELWSSDGTEAGTNVVVDAEFGPGSSYPDSLRMIGSSLYWNLNSTQYGHSIWRTDGATSERVAITDPPVTRSGVDRIDSRSMLNGFAYFHAFTNEMGDELWRTDGTATGTHLVKDIAPGFIAGSKDNVGEYVALGSLVYFVASTPGEGYELWVTDGSEAGTHLVKDIYPGPIGSRPFSLSPANGLMYFLAEDPDHGLELWRSDGTEAETQLVRDFLPGPDSVFGSSTAINARKPLEAIELNGSLYFRVPDAVGLNAIWKSDGTQASTTVVTQAASIKKGWSPHKVGNEFLFWADGLWKTDGTDNGTVFLKKPTPPTTTEARLTTPFVYWNGLTYFMTDSVLWQTDGTASGTQVVFTIPVAKPYEFKTEIQESSLVALGDRLYILFTSRARGTELWQSDGTANGSAKVKSIIKYGNENGGYALSSAGGLLYFTVTKGNGLAVWRSDGTVDGTRSIAFPAGNLTPRFLMELNGEALIRADVLSTGYELATYHATTAMVDHYSLEAGPRLNVPALSGVLANDTDGAARPAVAVLVKKPRYGLLNFRSDGSFTYQPKKADFSGTDSFTYKAAGLGDESYATTVTIDVDLANQAPNANDDAAAGLAGKTLKIDVLANDRDPDFDTFKIDSFTQGASGKVRKAGTQLTYSPNSPSVTSDTFTYTIRDLRGATSTATASVSLTPTGPAKITSVRVYPGSGPYGVDLLKPGKRVLPFQNLNRIEIGFSADVDISADDLRLLGIAGVNYTLVGFSYEPVEHLATWTIAGSNGGLNDRLTLLLDGSATTGVTNTGTAFGDRAWKFKALTGDYNGNGTVTASDAKSIKRFYGLPTGPRWFADVNGDGTIDQLDYNLAFLRIGERVI